jgi:hypothetical protein
MVDLAGKRRPDKEAVEAGSAGVLEVRRARQPTADTVPPDD